MADTAIVSTAQINGRVYTRSATRNDDGVTEKAVSVPVAKTGSLTTRTNNTDGTLTMASGHGIQTGDKIFLFWSGGQRRTVTVGTVSVNSVPISSGSGDSLPAASTAITACVRQSEEFLATGDNVLVAAAFSDAQGCVIFADSSNVEIYAVVLTSANSWWWDTNGNGTNPLAGGTIAKLFLGHADSAVARQMRAVVTYP